MINLILSKLFGTRNQRVVKRMRKTVAQINALETTIQALTDTQLSEKTALFRKKYQEGVTLNQLLPEAFAVVREASRRTMGMRHFDVQLIGGLALHEGKIAEMKTGEGKTLMSTLAAYLNALTGKGVHIVTVNDYLAKRDAKWMSPIYTFLGLTVGVNLPDMSSEEKKQAYAADITYGTNNEFGFDYLRDNMVFSLEHRVQRALHYAIVDEVDSILIDEARTPLIISGPSEDSSELYIKINQLIPNLKPQLEEGGEGDYALDEKSRQAFLTEAGQQKIEALFVDAGLVETAEDLYNPGNISLLHHLNSALRAHTLYRRDVDYIVKNGEVVIVDEHTGRLMAGRRWSDGLHQAVEAKEKVAIQNENQTLASITFQNYFRLYEKLSGMTGTADTEAYEFQQIYGLEVVVIPTNKPVLRQDMSDQIYLTMNAKFNAIVEEIKARQKKGQPLLVGTASIESSERLSHLLNQEEIPHQVLNAKFHEAEAKIIAQAGKVGAVTIATNMAGRGTDIVLGGSLENPASESGEDGEAAEQLQTESDWKKNHAAVVEAGGLHVLGTERHESRRIDNQLRGRSGRQGDPGSSQFFLSLEDNLMRIFASDRVANIMKRLGMKDEEAIVHPLITRAIESAQRKVEGHNFDIRKNLLEYDDIANDQRKVIYQQRHEIMLAQHISESIDAMLEEILNESIDRYIPPQSFEEQWDIPGLMEKLEKEFSLSLNIAGWLEDGTVSLEEDIRERVQEEARKILGEKRDLVTLEKFTQVEKSIMLESLDHGWRDHLAKMDHLRQGIHLRGYAQKNPVQEYKREAFVLFEQMMQDIKRKTISTLLTLDIQLQEVPTDEDHRDEQLMGQVQLQHASLDIMHEPESQSVELEGNSETFTRSTPKVGRNDPCPCGSGKKYKQCHGKLA